jgi:hypothetical protein
MASAEIFCLSSDWSPFSMNIDALSPPEDEAFIVIPHLNPGVKNLALAVRH